MARQGITTYHYCRCGETVKVPKGESVECKCKKVFGVQSKAFGLQINMRKTLSGTTKMEFSTTTMDESIKRMNK